MAINPRPLNGSAFRARLCGKNWYGMACIRESRMQPERCRNGCHEEAGRVARDLIPLVLAKRRQVLSRIGEFPTGQLHGIYRATFRYSSPMRSVKTRLSRGPLKRPTAAQK